MRSGSTAVKLQFDNVRCACGKERLQVGHSRVEHENHAVIPRIGQFARFGAYLRGGRNIDGNGSLPYKPRQLSAMARFDRGGLFWAGNGLELGPTSLDLISISGELPGQRRTTREADLSTQQIGAQAPSRLSRPSCDDRGPQGSRRAPRAGPQASERLSASSRDIIMDRLRQRADFIAVANGARMNSAAFVVQSRVRDDEGPVRIGFTVTKKNGTATERNRIRRRLRELVKRLDSVSMRPHSDYVLVGRRAALNRDFAIMLDDLRSALRRLHRAQPHVRPSPQLELVTRPER
jgi:ribonuclease P protein component